MGVTQEVRSTCPYCGVGCGVLIETDGQVITGVRGDPAHPANFGRLCSKGATLHLTARPHLRSARALYPEYRRSRGEPRQRASWDETLDTIAERFAACIREHGPASVGVYVSGQLLTEDYYVFNKFVKGLIGTNNIDTNSRLCMSSAVTGYKQTLGADSPPCSYEDLDHAEVVFIAGSNTAFAHPILYRRLEGAKERRPDLKMIVVDPRRTETAREADLHLAILPGTDVALFNAMLHVLLWEGLVDRRFIEAHTEGFAAVREQVADYTPRAVAGVCGIPEEAIVQAARWFGESRATLSLYCQGLNQSSSGTAKNAALINLHLATGQIGRPGAGPFSLTGQPNAMGGREVGGLANQLPAHRDLANAEHRAEVARFWGVETVSAKPGKTAVEMFEALRTGEIKMVWIACTNPAQSLPNQVSVREALQQAEFVVLQEAYHDTECAPYADALLPAASWGEKEGTVTNSERRITRLRRAIPPPGEALPDWCIVVALARRLEARLRPGQATLFPFETTEQVWNEHRELTRGRDLDITGLSYALLEDPGPQQWPMPEGRLSGKPRLYEDGIFPTENGKARFVATPYQPVAERVSARYPFALTTGRLRDQWHTLSRTGTVAQLYSHTPEPRLTMHADDMLRRGLKSGALVKVESMRGGVYLLAEASDEVRPGQVFVPMHWGERFLAGRDSCGINTLTLPALDPSSKQPELKHAAVRISAAQLPWRLTAFGYPEGRTAFELLDALAPLLKQYPFASVVLIGRDPEGVLLRLAAEHSPDAAAFAWIDELFELNHPGVIRYDDARHLVSRRIDVKEGRLRAVRLSGRLHDLAAEPWLKDWLTRGEPIEPIRRLLLKPSHTPPAGYVARGKIVCSCWNVSADQITDCLASLDGPPEAQLQALQDRLKCGTHCGSCVPELKQQIQAQQALA